MKLIATPQVLVVSMVEARDGLLWPAMHKVMDAASDPFDVYRGNAHSEAQHHGIAECTTDDTMWVQSVKHNLTHGDGYGACVACEVEDGNAVMIAPMPAQEHAEDDAPGYDATLDPISPMFRIESWGPGTRGHLPIRQLNYDEPFPEGHDWREFGIWRDCGFGCKLYVDGQGGQIVAHNGTYGCRYVRT